MRDLRLYVFDGGTIVCDDYSLFDPRVGPGVTRTMTVRSYLVVHPAGTLLFDTGLPDALAARGAPFDLFDVFHYRVTRPLGDQLADLGVAPEQVDLLALSHLHDDHVGNVSLFPAATLVLQHAELDAAFGPTPEAFHYQPHTYAGVEQRPRELTTGDWDVFGDGRVVLLALPGHTPGHQGLMVELSETGRVVLGADVAHSLGTLAAEVITAAHTEAEPARASMRRLNALAAAGQAAIWLHHDADQQRAIALAPTPHV